MNYQELSRKITQANEETSKGNFDTAEQIVNEVLGELNKIPNQMINDKEGFSESADASVHDEFGTSPVITIRANALLAEATITLRKGKFDLAREQAHRILDLVEEDNISEINAKAWNILGMVHRNLGSYDKALEYYGKALAVREKLGDKSGAARVTTNIGIVYADLGSYDKALEYYDKARTVYEEIGDKSGAAGITGNIGNVYQYIGSFDKALEYFEKALAVRDELGEKSGAASITGNIGIVYQYLGSYDKALEYYAKALAVHEVLGEKSVAASVTGNIGIVYQNLGSYDKALEYYAKVLAVREELGEKSGVANVTGNIGVVYHFLGSYDKALEYYVKALAVHEELGEKSGVATVTGNIGELYSDKNNEGYDAVKAEEFLLKALAINTEIGAKHQLVDCHKYLANLYENEDRVADAFVHYKKYIEVEKEVQIEEVKKQAEQREREKEIEIAKAAATAKLNATTALLHKVLPESIATRMIAGEENIADYFPTVTILFADIAGFTPISAGMPAAMVVRFLNYVFGTFDTIMKKYGCEKIKTIGDGYMAVAGAPIPCDDHAERMSLAALEMQQDINLPEEFKEYLPAGTDFGIRIGLHTGSVVGGVIGDERFVYDIYSDAVNTAARMESHGEPDKIHVSEEFLKRLLMVNGEWLIEDADDFSSLTIHHLPLTIIPRGEMDIKGKGKMKTYFLEAKQ